MGLFDRMKKGLEGAVEKGAKLSKEAIDKTEKLNRLRRLRVQKREVIQAAGTFAMESPEIQHERLAALRATAAELDEQIAALEEELAKVKDGVRESLAEAKEKTAQLIEGEPAAPVLVCECGAELGPVQQFCGQCGCPAPVSGAPSA